MECNGSDRVATTSTVQRPLTGACTAAEAIAPRLVRYTLAALRGRRRAGLSRGREMSSDVIQLPSQYLPNSDRCRDTHRIRGSAPSAETLVRVALIASTPDQPASNKEGVEMEGQDLVVASRPEEQHEQRSAWSQARDSAELTSAHDFPCKRVASWQHVMSGKRRLYSVNLPVSSSVQGVVLIDGGSAQAERTPNQSTHCYFPDAGTSIST